MKSKKNTRKEAISQYDDRLKKNSSEYYLQEQILISAFNDEDNKIAREIINRAVFEFAQNTNQSIYDVCLNYIPKVCIEKSPGLKDPLGGRAYTLGVTIEMMHIPDDGFIKTVVNNGTKENSEGSTAGRRLEKSKESN